MNSVKAAGTLLFTGALQCVIVGLLVAESLYPGYSVSENYISDLGVGSTALVFNSSVFLLGLTMIAGAYFVQRGYSYRLLSVCILLAGIGAMGVGLFPETAGAAHVISSLTTFLFGGLAAITSYRLFKLPFNLLSIILGAMSLVALALFASRTYLGLGCGGMERMVAYPTLLWAIGFGGYLMGQPEKIPAKT
jgi:hypothetical membrane protein